MKESLVGQNWKEFQLREVGEIVTGGTPPRSDKENYSLSGTPWIKPPNLDKEKWISKSEEYLSKEGQKKSRMVSKGAVIVSCIGNIGKVAIADCKLSTNQQINSIIPNENVDSEFLFYSIKNIQKRLENLASNAVVPLLNKTGFSKAKILFPVLSNGTPNLKKQKQIVAILEKAEGLKNKGKGLDELFDEYLKSVFWEMFLKEKGKFEEVALGEISKISMGGTPLTSKQEYWQPAEINWMKSGNIKGDYIRSIPQKISKEGLEKSNATIFPKGTIVIALNGQGKTRGTSSILEVDTSTNQSVAGIMINREQVLSEYLHYNLKMRYIELRNITGDDSRSGLNLTILRNFKVVLPNISLQEKFASIVEQVEKIKDKLKDEKKDADDLFNVLMQKAFSGELI